MRTTLSDCTVQPASRRPGSTRLLRLFGGSLLVLGLALWARAAVTTSRRTKPPSRTKSPP